MVIFPRSGYQNYFRITNNKNTFFTTPGFMGYNTLYNTLPMLNLFFYISLLLLTVYIFWVGVTKIF